MPQAMWIHYVGLILGFVYVYGCGDQNNPVVKMCYSNEVTFDKVGYATSEGVTSGSRDCVCTLSTDGAVVQLKVKMLPYTAPNCEQNVVKLKGNSPFATKFHCGKNQQTTFSAGSSSPLTQTYQRRTTASVCMQYSRTSGSKKVKISCTADTLPSATTNVSAATSKTTVIIASSPTKAITTTASPVSLTSRSTSDVTRFTFGPTQASNPTLPDASSVSPPVNTSVTGGVSVPINVTATSNDSETTTTTIPANNSTVSETTSPSLATGTTSAEITTLENSNPQDNNNLERIIAGSVVGGLVFILLVVALLCYVLKRRKRKEKQMAHKRMSEDNAIENKGYRTTENGSYGGKSKAYTVEDDLPVELGSSATPTNGGDPKSQNDQQNGSSGKPVQETGDSDDISALYATVNKKSLDKADTLF